MHVASKVARSSIRVVVLAIALGTGMVSHVNAQDQIDQALNQAGEAAYTRFCTPCHGPGGAPGTAVSSKDKKPVDLRTYVARNGGTFPAGMWLAMITDPNPKLTHARVWERIRRAQAGANPGAAARGVVAEIARYVNSIQAKP